MSLHPLGQCQRWFCECNLDSVNFSGIVTEAEPFPFLLSSSCHGFRLRRQGCALFCSGLWSHRVASLLIAMIILSIHTAGGRQSKRSSRYPQVVWSLTGKQMTLILSEVSWCTISRHLWDLGEQSLNSRFNGNDPVVSLFLCVRNDTSH